MNEELTDGLKDKMIYNSFIAEDRAMSYRFDMQPGTMVPETKTHEDFEQIVVDEVSRLERTLNVVTAVNVEDYQVEIAILLGESADEEIVRDAVNRLNYNVLDTVIDS